jgi:diguanylate cyclase (GGDEF)-like protein
MGNPIRRRWLALVLGWLVLPVQAQSIDLARLDADPPATEVVSGRLDERFSPVTPADVLYETSREPRWWRLRVSTAVAARDSPYLVLQAPYQNRVEAWLPGARQALRRSVFGNDADPAFSARALTVPLPQGLSADQVIYLRVHTLGSSPMPVAILPLAELHRQDMAHIAWRTSILTTLVVLSILALGFWAGIEERGYLFLALTLMSQLLYLASMGGELRGLEWLGSRLGEDPRLARAFGMLSVIASNLFIGFYLDLRHRRPWMMRILDLCSLVIAGLLVATLLSTATVIPQLGNLVLLVATLTVMAAAVAGTLQRHRPAYFLLLSWLPMMLLIGFRVAELLGWWAGPAWLIHAFPLGFAMAGLVLTFGLADKLQQLRRDRDHASQLAASDALTGVLSRSAVLARMQQVVDAAHAGNAPMSVVFFDIDHFKQINDRHGHLVGDQCLRLIALRCRNRLRSGDCLGRYGGDEMLVVLPDTALEQALQVAEHLREAVNNRPLTVGGHVIEASLSLGVAQLGPAESYERLLERVDTALYSSKSAGRDRVTGDTTVYAQEL